MEQLPKELENIIYTYKDQLDHYEKFKHCISKIKEIRYIIKDASHSIRFIPLTKDEKREFLSSMIVEDTEFVDQLEEISYFGNDIHYKLSGRLLYIENYHITKLHVLN